ncbi:MAG: hypothetical protein JO137_07715 [Hyphomicrobiales bacterium]|nr:hypothetical protein [Hyphomicrobiales bacterium]MBV9738517.1 hypothetical protein [Hyphomicrobiales bacterium]
MTREINVTETSFYLAFSTFNLLLLLTTSVVLSNLYAKARQLTQNTMLLTEVADQMARIDRHSASAVALIAREISSDIGKLREMEFGNDTEKWQLQLLNAKGAGSDGHCFFCQTTCSEAPLIEGRREY